MILKTADRIRELREKNNLTQTQLARTLYVSRSCVNAWEMAVSIPSTQKIIELCRILHTTSDYLLGIDSEETILVEAYAPEEKELLYRLLSYFNSRRSQGSDA